MVVVRNKRVSSECAGIFVPIDPFISTRPDACQSMRKTPGEVRGNGPEWSGKFPPLEMLHWEGLFELDALTLKLATATARTMATLRTCRPWRQANVWPTICSRSYAAMAVKSKQKPSGSQTSPTPRSTLQSPKTEPQPSDGKAEKSKSRPSSLESAAEQNLKAMESMKRFSKMYAMADVWGTEMTNLGMAAVPGFVR